MNFSRGQKCLLIIFFAAAISQSSFASDCATQVTSGFSVPFATRVHLRTGFPYRTTRGLLAYVTVPDNTMAFAKREGWKGPHLPVLIDDGLHGLYTTIEKMMFINMETLAPVREFEIRKAGFNLLSADLSADGKRLLGVWSKAGERAGAGTVLYEILNLSGRHNTDPIARLTVEMRTRFNNYLNLSRARFIGSGYQINLSISEWDETSAWRGFVWEGIGDHTISQSRIWTRSLPLSTDTAAGLAEYPIGQEHGHDNYRFGEALDARYSYGGISPNRRFEIHSRVGMSNNTRYLTLGVQDLLVGQNVWEQMLAPGILSSAAQAIHDDAPIAVRTPTFNWTSDRFAVTFSIPQGLAKQVGAREIVQIWSTNRSTPTVTLKGIASDEPGGVYSMSFDPSGESIYVMSGWYSTLSYPDHRSSLRRFNSRTGELTGSVPTPQIVQNVRPSAILALPGRRLIIESSGQWLIYDTEQLFRNDPSRGKR